MNKIINVSLLTLYCSLIYWLSSRTHLPTPMLFMHQDKVVHTAAYFIMGVLAWRFFNDYFNKQSTVFIVSICFCSLYGISDEWHQSMVPGRTPDIWDWLVDTLGAILAMACIHLVKKRFKKNNNES